MTKDFSENTRKRDMIQYLPGVPPEENRLHTQEREREKRREVAAENSEEKEKEKRKKI